MGPRVLSLCICFVFLVLPIDPAHTLLLPQHFVKGQPSLQQKGKETLDRQSYIHSYSHIQLFTVTFVSKRIRKETKVMFSDSGCLFVPFGLLYKTRGSQRMILILSLSL